MPEHRRKKLMELLEYAIVQRFLRLTGAEIEAMFQLTPLEETVAGKELIQKGETRGETRGEARGELIGMIRAWQMVLGLKAIQRRTLVKKSLEELRRMADELEARVKQDQVGPRPSFRAVQAP